MLYTLMLQLEDQVNHLSEDTTVRISAAGSGRQRLLLTITDSSARDSQLGLDPRTLRRCNRREVRDEFRRVRNSAQSDQAVPVRAARERLSHRRRRRMLLWLELPAVVPNLTLNFDHGHCGSIRYSDK